MIDSTELIQACLDATPTEHAWEVTAEHWHTELGERPATHIASDSERDMTGFFVGVAWAWIHRTGQKGRGRRSTTPGDLSAFCSATERIADEGGDA